MGYSAEQIASLKNGYDQFLSNHCNLCHSVPTLMLAAIPTNAALVTPIPGKFFGPSHSRRAFGPDAIGPNHGAAAAGINPYGNVVTRDLAMNGKYKLMDVGFANTGVSDPDDDPGLAQYDGFGNPLSFSEQYAEFLLGNA